MLHGEEETLTNLSIFQLKQKCKELGIKNYSSKNKANLIDLLIQNTVEKETSTLNDTTSHETESTAAKIVRNKGYSELSINLTKQLKANEKKHNGIYFTPPKTIEQNLTSLEPYMRNVKSVLEPSCGSCEYILSLKQKYYDLDIVGIEFNQTIYAGIQHLQHDITDLTLYNMDYLKYSTENKYDLIIGNPPYFVMSKNDIDRKDKNNYINYFEGRPNIFVLFIIKSLGLLNDGGILSFVLPKSFLNCIYYDKTRKHIFDNFRIIDIIECDDSYLETFQETIILIIQKNIDTHENPRFTLIKNTYTIFGSPESIHKLYDLYRGSTTLANMGFKVNVGNVVWNQCKDELTNDETKTLLIYSSDIKNNVLEIQHYKDKNEQKLNYIDREGDTSPLLIINRGYGVGKYNFTYCLIDMDKEYCVENHLICVKYTNEISDDELRELYEKIMASFENSKTKEFIELYFGNNAINTTELCNMLPIYLDV